MRGLMKKNSGKGLTNKLVGANLWLWVREI